MDTFPFIHLILSLSDTHNDTITHTLPHLFDHLQTRSHPRECITAGPPPLSVPSFFTPLHPSLSSRLLPHPVNLFLSPSLCLIKVMYLVCELHFERLQRESSRARCSSVSTSSYEMFQI